MENDLLKAIEEQVEVWHIEAQKSKEIRKSLSPYADGFRNGEIYTYEKILALIKLGELKNEI